MDKEEGKKGFINRKNCGGATDKTKQKKARGNGISRFRTAIQAIAVLIQNANLKGFFTGKLYSGPVKNVCVPGLNCYSCPGAVGACPIGSLQNALSAMHFRIPYYVCGFLLFFGALLGRAICGFLCPFGFLQDIIYKIPFLKKVRTFKGDAYLRYLKYLVLILMVLILPFCFKLTPFFCKYLCPSGTVAGILLSLADTSLWKVMGGRFAWKVSVLIAILLVSLMICRPFCRYLCPLGAFYGIMNRFSLLQLHVNSAACIHCGICEEECPMAVNPAKHPNSCECIRCGKCAENCPKDAIAICPLQQITSRSDH